MSGFRRRRSTRSSSKPLEIREPDLDERPDLLLEPGLARDRERLLEALPNLRRVDALLEPVVAGDEQLLDLLAGFVPFHFRLGKISFSSLKWQKRSAS